MATILEIDDLSYNGFSNINYSFKDKTYYSIIGSNNSGKTTLFKLIAGIIPSSSCICCNDIDLNKRNISKYIVNLGIVTRVTSDSFKYNKVIDEMIYPLDNLGYSRTRSIDRIKEILSLFNKSELIDKRIIELNSYDKELLLIMIALLHKPKVLLLDSVLDIFPRIIYEEINVIFNKLVKEGLTIINFTNSLEIAYYSDKIILLDNHKIIGEYLPKDILNDDKLFYEHNLEIPFLVDLNIKLKMYDLIKKDYSSMKEMVDDIWP